MNGGADAALRIGCVKYLNARPLIHGWPGPIVFDHPAALCAMLARGALDVAFVSSFEFLRNPVYTIVDDVAVASEHEVYSVFLAHRGAFDDVEEIALDPASLTSVHLLRCVLAERALHLRLVDDIDDEITERSAKLMIGDQAIRYRQRHENEYAFIDLAAEWRQLTALPFVFALWLIRPDYPNAEAVAVELRKLRDANLAALDDVIASQSEFAPEFCDRYFRQHLRFSFGEAEKQGLLRFRALCQRHGLLPPSEMPLPLI